MKERDLILYAILAVAAYFLLKKGGAILATATAPISDAVASAWLAATLPASMTVLGNVVFPDGTQVPLNELAPRADGTTGAVSLMYGQHIYSLLPSDANGNWPAVLVQ